MFGFDTVLDQLILATAWVHVLVSPYTKVEESFNLHAIHDVLVYGIGPTALRNYDHFVFPGAVPRTFLGSVLLAWVSTPVIRLAGLGTRLPSKFDLQIIARLALATVNATSLGLVRSAVSRRFGRLSSLFFVLLTCSQFHLPFWMGRTLPNMFALFPVNIALYFILDLDPQTTKPPTRRTHAAIALLTFSAVVFRSEVLLLLGPLAIQYLFLGYTTLAGTIKVGLISGLTSLAITLCLDSYFWGRWPLWPEFVGLYFNVYQGNSSDWGISPPYAYFTSHLPKLLLGSLPLSLLGAVLDPNIRTLLLPPVVFVVLISNLGHKEWRFIVYVVPFFNIAAARGASWMVSRKNGSIRSYILRAIAIGVVISNIALTTLQTSASMRNYPGGQAMVLFDELYHNIPRAHVHISNLAAQTGASLFLQTHAPPYRSFFNSSALATDWTYNKTEFLSPRDLTAAKHITHLITEEPCLPLLGEWKYMGSVTGFERWKLDFGVIRERAWSRLGDVLTMVTGDKLCILERNASMRD